MQAAERIDSSELGLTEAAIERLAAGLEAGLRRRGGLEADAAREARRAVPAAVWRRLLAASGPQEPAARARGGVLAVAAGALRRHGGTAPDPAERTPIPDGLDAAALQGAQREIIPGRRSVAGLHLRGLHAREMAPIFGLVADEMEARLVLALQDLRTVLHRRAQRMNRADWSRAFEAQPVEAMRGMLRERPARGVSRLRCSTPEDLAEAVNGTHFRGGREGALDHACVCDPCAAELRALIGLRTDLEGLRLTGVDLPSLRAAAAGREDLRPWIEEAASPGRRRRRWWLWALGLLVVAAAIAWLR